MLLQTSPRQRFLALTVHTVRIFRFLDLKQKSAQRGSFRLDVPADIQPKTSVRPSRSWKRQTFRCADAAQTSTKKNLVLKNFGADFSRFVLLHLLFFMCFAACPGLIGIFPVEWTFLIFLCFLSQLEDLELRVSDSRVPLSEQTCVVSCCSSSQSIKPLILWENKTLCADIHDQTGCGCQ